MERMENLSDDNELVVALNDLSTLYDAARRANEKNKILQAAISQIGMKALEADPDSPENMQPAEGAYEYIPVDLNSFFEQMYDLENVLSKDTDYLHTDLPHRPCSFIEAGCGIGRNLHLLRATNRFALDKICGFDIVEKYVEIGRTAFDLGNDIFKDDVLNFDYGGHDIIYFYRPFHDDALEVKFEKQLVSTMKRGAYVVATMNLSLDTFRELIPKGNSYSIWKRT